MKIKTKFLPRALVLLGATVIAHGTGAATLSQSDVTTYYFGVGSALPDASGRTVVDRQHTDIGIPYSGGEWDLHVHGDTVGELGANEALLYANSSAQTTMPDMPFYNSFIGASAGENVWILPQTQNPNVIFLGFGAEEMSPADIDSLALWNPGDARGGANTLERWLKVELVSYSGPGEFSMWSNSIGFGNPDVFFSTAQGGITSEDVVYVLAGGHSHFNWAFTEAGEYEINLRVSTYVVPEPSTVLLVVGAGAFSLLAYSQRKKRAA